MQDSSTSGFWEKHDPSEYGNELPPFLDEADINGPITNGTVIQIVGVREDEEARYGPAFRVDLDLGEQFFLLAERFAWPIPHVIVQEGLLGD